MLEKEDQQEQADALGQITWHVNDKLFEHQEYSVTLVFWVERG